MKRFPAIHLDEDDAAYRQIAFQLRALILSGELKPGTRLPAMRDLAKDLGTNYFTVQAALTPLAREGLIERKPKHGTVVLRNSPLLKTVGIYLGAALSHSGSFYPGLYDALFEQFEHSSIEAKLFVDTRRPEKQIGPFPLLQKSIQNHEIQAIIACMLVPNHITWLREFGIPLSMLTTSHWPNSVKSDNRQMVEASLKQLATRGCKKVALLPRPSLHNDEYISFCQKVSKELGIRILDDCMENYSMDHYPTREEFGYQAMKKLWNLKDRPDGLMVYPDTFVPGVITALMELGIRIPDELKLIFHGNKEIPIHCPLQADWVKLSINDMAQAMIHQLQLQVIGKTPKETLIFPEIIPGY